MKKRLFLRAATFAVVLLVFGVWSNAAGGAEPAAKKSGAENKSVPRAVKKRASFVPPEEGAKVAERGTLLPPPGEPNSAAETTDGDLEGLPSLPPPLPPGTVRRKPPVRLTGNRIADLPRAGKKTAADRRRAGKSSGGLEEMRPEGLLTARAHRAYKLLASTRADVLRISADLDDYGKEYLRLLETTRRLLNATDEFAAFWPKNRAFRLVCGNCKREVLTLKEELAREPPRWRHVLWAFDAVRSTVGRMRRAARLLAEAEPKPVLQYDKSGKPVVVMPPDEKVATTDHEAARKARLAELEKEKSRWKRRREGDGFESKLNTGKAAGGTE